MLIEAKGVCLGFEKRGHVSGLRMFCGSLSNGIPWVLRACQLERYGDEWAWERVSREDSGDYARPSMSIPVPRSRQATSMSKFRVLGLVPGPVRVHSSAAVKEVFNPKPPKLTLRG